ncbi:hypothetical protein DTO282F9_3365 [Paecilomyces variotii]|nr:hypothetical protein DTO282E5_7279 [Paecilomyces variotii]KAJ9399751.1 hypothetical protein DTO282F9_3365 [Paecilomyces variotii]
MEQQRRVPATWRSASKSIAQPYARQVQNAMLMKKYRKSKQRATLHSWSEFRQGCHRRGLSTTPAFPLRFSTDGDIAILPSRTGCSLPDGPGPPTLRILLVAYATSA